MSVHLPDTSWRHWPETKKLLAACEAMHAPVRFVGGCVRDALMGKEAKDIDLATPILPPHMMEGLQAQGIRVLATGLSHGTVTVVIKDKHFEITTLRRDMVTDGRHAEVAFTKDWQEDAARRDFTVNALYSDAQGIVYDEVGGLADLKARYLRFIGNAHQRIEEDGLRILRYFRFLAQLGFELDEEALLACQSHALILSRISGERIQQEMRKFLTAAFISDALMAHMQTCGVLAQIFNTKLTPAISPLLSAQKYAGIAVDWRVRLAFILQQTDAEVSWVAERWRLSNADRIYIHTLLAEQADIISAISEAAWKKTIRRLGKQLAMDCVLLAWARDISLDPENAKLWNENYSSLMHIAHSWEIPVFPLTGQDLLDAGMLPGIEIGNTLKLLENKWEEKEYGLTKAELLLLAETAGGNKK